MDNLLNRLIIQGVFCLGVILLGGYQLLFAQEIKTNESEKVITRAKGTAEEERNRKAVLDFYDAVINKKEYSRAPEWVDPGYKQHKPQVTDGPNGVLDFMRNITKLYPNNKVQIVRSFVDGDYVILHVHVMQNKPGVPDRAVMDIFRCKNGKLLEHWDVDQEVPAASEFKNSNGIF